MGRLLARARLRQPAQHFVALGKRLVAPRHLHAWMCVQQGFAKGIWMHLNLPTEGYWRGTHEPDVQALLHRLLKPGAVFYDVGAHLGYFALPAARLVGATGKVVAFDPDPENAARIRRNAEYNRLSNVLEVMEAALWSRGMKEITYRRGMPRSQGGVSQDGQEPVLARAERITVACTSLDEIVQRTQRPPDLLKIDVEGGEPEVVGGGERLFAFHRPALICEIHRAREDKWFREWLQKNSYHRFWTAPEGSYPCRLVAIPEERAHQDADWEQVWASPEELIGYSEVK